LGSDGFNDVIPLLSTGQKALILSFMKAMEEERDLFRLREKDIAGFQKAADRLRA
jgi:hypothetical protein